MFHLLSLRSNNLNFLSFLSLILILLFKLCLILLILLLWVEAFFVGWRFLSVHLALCRIRSIYIKISPIWRIIIQPIHTFPFITLIRKLRIDFIHLWEVWTHYWLLLLSHLGNSIIIWLVIFRVLFSCFFNFFKWWLSDILTMIYSFTKGLSIIIFWSFFLNFWDLTLLFILIEGSIFKFSNISIFFNIFLSIF